MLTMLTAGPVLAETLLGPAKCGTKLVQVGETKDEILAKCGQPTRIDPWSHGGGETWYYDGSRVNFKGFFRFTGEKLTSIERSE
jgi:hypothetical protein